MNETLRCEKSCRRVLVNFVARFSPILFIMALSRKLALLHSFLLPYFAALISSANSLFSLRCIYFSLVAIPPLI